jgi:hypothetical protein
LATRQTCASFATNIQSEALLFTPKAPGTPRTGSDQIGQTLTEGTLRTGGLVAKEAPDVQEEADWPLEQGQIGQRAVVATMDTTCHSLTAWTGHVWCSRGQMHRDLIRSNGRRCQVQHCPYRDEEALKHELVF